MRCAQAGTPGLSQLRLLQGEANYSGQKSVLNDLTPCAVNHENYPVEKAFSIHTSTSPLPEAHFHVSIITLMVRAHTRAL